VEKLWADRPGRIRLMGIPSEYLLCRIALLFFYSAWICKISHTRAKKNPMRFQRSASYRGMEAHRAPTENRLFFAFCHINLLPRHTSDTDYSAYQESSFATVFPQVAGVGRLS